MTFFNAICLHSVLRIPELLSDLDLVNLRYWYRGIVVVKFVACNIDTVQETDLWLNLEAISIRFAFTSFTWFDFVINFFTWYVPAGTRLAATSYLLLQQQNKSNLSLDSADKRVNFIPFSSSAHFRIAINY